MMLELAAEDAETIVRIFSPDEAVRESIRSESMFNLIHEDSVIKVDCIVRKSSHYRREEFARRAGLNAFLLGVMFDLRITHLLTTEDV